MDLSKTEEAAKRKERIERLMTRPERRRAEKAPCSCGSGKSLINCCIDKVLDAKEKE